MMTLVKVGDVLADKYRVDRILGIGGMGIVIAATHVELEQRVALKFMLPDALASEAAVERFLREAKAAVKLRSEHVCRVLDVGRLDTGGPYIVMEYLEGEDLAQVIRRRGRLPVGEIVDVLLQALEGLAEAHANRIVHRDLKPGNLFITTDNDGSALVKVLDFGISKSSLGGSATKTGDIMGSPAYMAPEQMASSKSVDARADIWALGVMLYQAVTNVMPFEADTLPALCMAVMSQTPPSPAAHRPELPAAFAAAVMRCLAKDPEARFADVALLAAALAPFGSAEAAATATRIGKVLRRPTTTSPPPLAMQVTPMTTAARLAVTQGEDAPASQAPIPHPGSVSTLQSSAAELAIPPLRRKRTGTIAAISGAVVVAGIVVTAVVFGGRSGAGPAAAAAAPSQAPPTVTAEPITSPTPKPDVKPGVETGVKPPENTEAKAPEVQPAVVTPVGKPAGKPAIVTSAPHRCPTGQVLAAGRCTKRPDPIPVKELARDKPVPAVVAPEVSPDDRWSHMQHDKAH